MTLATCVVDMVNLLQRQFDGGLPQTSVGRRTSGRNVVVTADDRPICIRVSLFKDNYILISIDRTAAIPYNADWGHFPRGSSFMPADISTLTEERIAYLESLVAKAKAAAAV